MNTLQTLQGIVPEKIQCDCNMEDCFNSCRDEILSKLPQVAEEIKVETTKAYGFGYKQGKAEGQYEEREKVIVEIVEILDGWGDFSCHSRAEHEENDCPGWSHEDQLTRALVITQVRKRLTHLQTIREKKDE